MICPVAGCPGTVVIRTTARDDDRAYCERCDFPVSIVALIDEVDQLRERLVALMKEREWLRAQADADVERLAAVVAERDELRRRAPKVVLDEIDAKLRGTGARE